MYAASLLYCIPLVAQGSERFFLASTDTQCTVIDRHAQNPSVSADGRYVAFHTSATNLDPAAGGSAHVFLKDLYTGELAHLSPSIGGIPPNAHSKNAVVSADGSVVVFESEVNDLVPNDSNPDADVFLYDVAARTLELVSRDVGGGSAGGPCRSPHVSADGRLVTFEGSAVSFSPGPINGFWDVFLLDRATGVIELVSVTAGGAEPAAHSNGPAPVTPDGRYVAFGSRATDLGPFPTNNSTVDVFVRDRSTPKTLWVSQGLGGVQSQGRSRAPAISADGRFVAYESTASNHVVGDTNQREDVFVRDVPGGTTVRVSVATSGTQGDGNSWDAAISGDGTLVAFFSAANTLDPACVMRDQVYLYERASGVTRLAYGCPSGTFAYSPFLAGVAGRFLVVSSTTPFVPGHSNLNGDVYLLDRTARFGSAFCTPAPNSTGAPALLTGAGTEVVCFNSLELLAAPVPPEQLGMLAMSPTGVPPAPFGSGLLCLAPPVGLFRQSIQGAGPQGVLHFRPDLTSLPAGLTVAPGETWWFQAWYRDGADTNWSGGRAIRFQ